MKNFLLLMFLFLSAFFASAQTPTDLFFSEYVEGSGNNKALEIYNPTKQTIDLSYYFVCRYSNGNPTYAEGGITHLTGTIAPFETFILVNGQTTSTPTSPACSPILQAMADQLDGIYPAPTYMNGNDAIALLKTSDGQLPSTSNTTTPVDLIGQVGLGNAISSETGWSYVKDSTLSYTISGVPVTGKIINYIVQAKATNGTSTGPYWMSWTSNHSLIRKYNVVSGVKGNSNPFIVTMEWDTVPAVVDTAGYLNYEDIWTNLGKHDCAAPLSVNETPSDSWMTIYPNPVITDRFTITSSLPVKEVEIFSVIGKSVYKQTIKKGQQQLEIGPVALEKGIYMVKALSTNNVTAVKKILVK
jgi:hypothetical protein